MFDFLDTKAVTEPTVVDMSDVEEIEEEEVTAKEDIPESQEQEKAVLEPHNFRIQDNDLGAGGPKSKYKANMEAIHLLQTLEKEERLATPEEQEILSRYVGWGGIPQAFEENNSSWANEYLELSFKDSEEEMIESVLAALKTGRNIYCDEKNINPLKIHYGDIVILLATRELFRKQKKIDLSFTEFEILHLLMRSPGRVFSKEQIYDIIWNEPYSGDYNVVMRHICNIREKIEDDPGHPVYIQTVRGVGYRFNGNLGSE